MKLDADDITQIMEILQAADAYKPIVDKTIETIESFGPQFKKIADLLDEIRKFMVKSSISSFEEFQKSGFNREESILLTLNIKLAIAQLAEKKK